MSSSYYSRKYAGAPHSEKKRETAPTPSKLAPRKEGPSKAPSRRVKHLYDLARKYKIEGPWWDKFFFNPHVGHRVGTYPLYSAGEHVIRRLRANLIEDTNLKVYWIEEQATRAQLSPVFYSFEGVINWLLYLGLAQGWLKIKTHWASPYTFGHKLIPKKHIINFDKT